MPKTTAVCSAPDTTLVLSAFPGQTTGDGPVRIPLEMLVAVDSPRSEGVDHRHVRLLAEAEGSLPPIVVHAETLRVVDGMHRVAAARLLGREDIEAVLFRGSVEDAFRHAVGLNVNHGLPLSLVDRQAAALRIITANPILSDRAVARSAGLAPTTVASLRRRVRSDGGVGEVRVGSDGRVRPLNANRGRIAAGQIIAARPEASLREIAKAAGISVGTARDVRRRVAMGEHAVPAARAGAPVDAPAAGGQQGAVAAASNSAQLLDRLKRDPSLRYSDSGRALLQWLCAPALTGEQVRRMIEDVPPHCQEAIAIVLGERAREWAALADVVGRPGRATA